MEIEDDGIETEAIASMVVRSSEQCNSILDEIHDLARVAEIKGYSDFASILRIVNEADLSETKSKLDEYGYALEISIPQIKIKFRLLCDGHKAVETIYSDEFKAKIRKIIFKL